MTTANDSTTPAPFREGGEMGAFMATFDWSRTSLGPAETWPTSLRTTVAMVLRSRIPMMLWWGPRLLQLYNDAFLPMLGARHPRALGEPGEAVWGDLWPRLGPRAHGVLCGGPATRTEDLWLPIDRDGRREVACFTICFGAVTDDAGEVAGVLVTGLEAAAVDHARVLAAQAERDRAQRIVQDAEARMRLVLDAAALGIWDFDPVTGHLEADARFRALFGLSDETILDYSAVLQCIHPDDRERVDMAIRRMMDVENPEPLAIEYRTVGLDDGVERWVHARGKMLVDPTTAEIRCVGILRDNAADKALELEREARLDAMSRTVRFAELFVGVLGHDLRTPLNTIKLGAEVLAMREHDEGLRTPRASDLDRAMGGPGSPTQRILKSAERMRRMIDDLLDFTHARLGRGLPLAPRDANLMEIALACVEELQPEEPRIVVRAEGNPHGRWDTDRLAQLLTNLLANALEHGQRGSPVRVRIDGRQADRVELEVHNEGAIDPALLPAIFDPFASGRRKRGRRNGLGLGLYITQQIAMGHGGEIVASSSPEEGTRLCVALPRRAPTMPHPAALDPVAHEMSPRDK
jgi:PAS domain S-box-containing protein